MVIETFTNKNPTKSFKVNGAKKISFEKCDFKIGVKYKKDFILKVEFKLPTLNKDEFITITPPSIHLGTCVGIMENPNSPVVNINDYRDVPLNCIIIKVSITNTSNYLFDLVLETVIS